MSQYNDPFATQHADPYGTPKKTSGLAVSSLVLSLIGIIPCCGAITAPIGAILGLIGAVVIKPTSAVKGRGLAMTGFVIGLILTIGQALMFGWVWTNIGAPVMQGPDAALKAGFAGNVGGFKSAMYGSPASAPDAEAQAFIDTLRARYGEYQSLEMRGQQGSQQPGQTTGVFLYQLTFANGTVMCETEITFADPPQTDGFVMKPSQITVIDASQGDLSYPAGPPAGAPRTPVPSDGEQPPPATDVDTNGDPGSNGS
jgi:hypothetical protein